MSSAPANWYPDPQDGRQLRYWDGHRWTEHCLPNTPVPRPGQAGSPPPVTAPGPGRPPDAAVASGAGRKVPLFGARNVARQQADELERLRAQMAQLGVLDIAELQQRRDQLRADIAGEQERFQAERVRLERELWELRQRVVTTQEEAILQEVGVYTYRHPLHDSVAYQAQLQQVQAQLKAMVRRDGGAIQATTSWQVNGSLAQGRKMVSDFSKLMLRAYNAEADNLVRSLKPYKLASAVERLDKVAFTIERLGKTMSIKVAPEYHRLRVHELELTADYQETLAREKEKERDERERLREERKAQQEIQRERERLDKERQHYLNALAAVEVKGDTDATERMRAQLRDIDKAIEDVDYRAANVKAGYVYVISNLGAFGEGMVKIGMTRRLDPMDRIRELSDASVPFNFDVHALFFADNAADIETQMHHRLADRRVNRVNMRREFFHATPAEARDHLKALTGDLLQFNEQPEAIEFHQSSQPSQQHHESHSVGAS